MSETGSGAASTAQVMQVAEYQVVRPDGTVLLSAIAVPGQFGGWALRPGFEIQGPCAGRYRVLPDDESWTAEIYFPDGYPGRDGGWPEGMQEKLRA